MFQQVHSMESKIQMSKAKTGMKYRTLMNDNWRVKETHSKILDCQVCGKDRYLELLWCPTCRNNDRDNIHTRDNDRITTSGFDDPNSPEEQDSHNPDISPD